MYTKGGGLPHGRLLIGDGAVRKADVVAAANGRKARPSTSDSYRHLSEENHQLRRANEGLTQHNQHLTQQQEVDHELIMMLFAELGKEPLGHLLRRRQQVQAQFQTANNQCSSEASCSKL